MIVTQRATILEFSPGGKSMKRNISLFLVLIAFVGVSAFAFDWVYIGGTRNLKDPQAGCEEINQKYGYREVYVDPTIRTCGSKYYKFRCCNCYGRN